MNTKLCMSLLIFFSLCTGALASYMYFSYKYRATLSRINSYDRDMDLLCDNMVAMDESLSNLIYSLDELVEKLPKEQPKK